MVVRLPNIGCNCLKYRKNQYLVWVINILFIVWEINFILHRYYKTKYR